MLVLAKLRHHRLEARVPLTRGLSVLTRVIRIKDFFKQLRERINRAVADFFGLRYGNWGQ